MRRSDHEYLGLLGIRSDPGDRCRRDLAGFETMNPVPTDAQWLVLHQVDDGEVWFAGNGIWRARSPVGHFNVTRMLWRLFDLGLIAFGTDDKIEVTDKGMEALKRRSVYDVLERRNRRGQ